MHKNQIDLDIVNRAIAKAERKLKREQRQLRKAETVEVSGEMYNIYNIYYGKRTFTFTVSHPTHGTAKMYINSHEDNGFKVWPTDDSKLNNFNLKFDLINEVGKKFLSWW